MMIKIAISDDMPIVLEGIRLLLGRIPDFEVVAEYRNGKELVDHIGETDADIILTDIEMPVMDGITATRLILSEHPEKKIIALSMYSDSESYYDMIKSGAKGFVLKQSSISELECAIREVFNGGNYFSTGLLHNVIVNLPGKNMGIRQKNARIPELTEKEMNLLRQICKGLNNKELSAILLVSMKTIESYKSKLMEKTETRNTSGLILWALKNNIIDF